MKWLLAALLIGGTGAAAMAQEGGVCGPHDRVVAGLKDKFNEVPIGIGLIKEELIIQVFTSPDGSTWSIVSTTPQGLSCMLSSGHDWQVIERTDGPSL